MDKLGGDRDPSLPRHRLGDFELICELGRGGMGVVYKARQISLNRPVALKVLPPGLGLTSQSVQRFQREAQAAAKLHHTHIVPVYAVGEDQGCHFYAMELIDGQPLTEVLRDLSGEQKNELFEATITKLTPAGEPRAASTTPRREAAAQAPTSLSDTASGSRRWFDTVAKLMAEVAEALQYAHGHGIVHRDIKPGNLMLSKDGRLCVTDFGLAQVAQEPGMTVSGSLLGTPAYMSPEQVAAGRVKIDHRTDIYSLGTVLYEMLTLRRPFDAESREEVLSGILTKEPRPPRRVNPRVPVDLETICLKAIEKDPDRRYATAGLLAEDLRAHLSRGLIAARRASAGRRATKWVRRHPITTIVTTAAVVVAIISAIAVQQGFRGSHAEARRLVASAETDVREGTYSDGLAKVGQALKIAPDLFEARKTRGRLLCGLRRHRELANLANEILKDHPDDWEAHGWLAFAGEQGGLADIPAEEHAKAVERLAPDSAEAWYVKGMIAGFGFDAIRCYNRALEIDPGHAWALLQRGQAQAFFLSNYPAAIADFERVIAVRPRSPTGRRFLAYAYSGLGDAERALAECEKAIAIDPKDPMIYRGRSAVYDRLGKQDQRLADLTKSIELAPWYSRAVADRAQALLDLGRYEEGLAEARRAVQLEPNIVEGYWPVLAALRNLKRTDELRAAMEDLRRRADGWPNTKATAQVYGGFWVRDFPLGDKSTAIDYATKAIQLDPGNVGYYIHRAEARLRKQGQAAVDQDCDLMAKLDLREPVPLRIRASAMSFPCRRVEAALADYARVIEMAPAWPQVYSDRADLLRGKGRYREALADLDKAVELAPKWAEPLDRRAMVRLDLEQWPEALADLERTFALGAEPPGSRLRQATALAHLGRVNEALAAIDKIIQTAPKREYGYRNRAWLLFHLGRLDEALAAIDKAVEVEPGQFEPYRVRAYFLTYRPGSCARAEADLRKALEVGGSDQEAQSKVLVIRVGSLASDCPEAAQPGPSLELAKAKVSEDPGNERSHYYLAQALYDNGRFEEARAALAKSLTLARGGLDELDPERQFWLVMTETKLGRKADAHRDYSRAVERMNATWPKSPDLIRLRSETERGLGR